MKKAYGWMTGLMLLSFVTVGVFLTLAPDTIPAHYDLSGNIDRWGSKYEYLLFPFLTILMGVFLACVARQEGKKGRVDNEKVVVGVGIWVMVLFNAIWAFFLWKALDAAELSAANGLSIKVVYLLLAASLIPVGNNMPKAQRNSVLGLRTKWSMADDVCWQKSQRLGGFLMVGTGILGVALVSLVPAAWAGATILALILVTAVAATAGTYGIWKREQK